MKASVLNKSILSIVFVFICSMAINAASPRSYIYDTKEENGKIVSKTVFTNDNGLLNKQVMYEFTYDKDGKVAEKKARRWNKASETWEPFYLISYQYDNENGTIHSVYGMWDKKTNAYDLNIQEMTLSSSNYEEIFS
ncbi:hypothetical protein M2459_002625 [Parabacteroides sp. PF5-5]|uniref:DUF3836 domain-containing protein n=1 Tax=unclassified Parabacteroides TaxID=2649774 RepID=UPI0024761143|nr:MULTISPECIES: DUF3836 domain-containing protein [unclassified Parabacteroides]MDH6306262.1 hypothetical protein [Parabacteroides sp. PH5-39]MDH6316947.1 hypothetical protein [Parabacteroides sp. PF5-13]MDH6321016.1 hypothetical protein [Parabacteroides sp. PH5-13]MDH6324748.1 hypothetical protein [Parabacteroides sp. PH5-8]MDH6328132.1 hypothetical protein [Parabacteroides sp. PH5-41]